MAQFCLHVTLLVYFFSNAIYRLNKPYAKNFNPCGSVAVSSTLLFIPSLDKTNQLSKNYYLSMLKEKKWIHSIKKAKNDLFSR